MSPGWAEPWSYDLFEPDGRYLGRVPIREQDASIRVLRMRGDTAWGHTLNADGAPIVVRYVVRWR
jgi:hypothetical protein